MEAATTTAPRPVARPAERRLPPGPPLPPAWSQTAIWSRKLGGCSSPATSATATSSSSEIAYEGNWVMWRIPRRQAGLHRRPAGLSRGRGEPDLAPVARSATPCSRSTRGDHLEPAQVLLPPFHGERMKEYGDRSPGSPGARSTAGRPAPDMLRPRMQAVTLEIILRDVFGVREGERRRRFATALRGFLDMATNPRFWRFLIVGPEGSPASALPPTHRPGRRADLP